MKKILGVTAMAFAAAILFSVESYGQDRGGINSRQRNQRERIFNGVRSGELTVRETKRLVHEQRSINRQEARFRESGEGLNWRERSILQSRLSGSSYHVYKQKHDKQDYPRP